MLKILSDSDIESLVKEGKIRPNGLVPLGHLAERNNHRRRDYQVDSATDSGNEFVIAIRQSMINPLDFSAILGYKVPGSNLIFRLRRYNGSSHTHTNPIEKITIVEDFHVHYATERYQRQGHKEDTYAEPSLRHSSLETAIRSLLDECGFNNPPSNQGKLFE